MQTVKHIRSESPIGRLRGGCGMVLDGYSTGDFQCWKRQVSGLSGYSGVMNRRRPTGLQLKSSGNLCVRTAYF